MLKKIILIKVGKFQNYLLTIQLFPTTKTNKKQPSYQKIVEKLISEDKGIMLKKLTNNNLSNANVMWQRPIINLLYIFK